MVNAEALALDYCSTWSTEHALLLLEETRRLAKRSKSDFVSGVLAIQESLLGSSKDLPQELSHAAMMLHQGNSAQKIESLRTARLNAGRFNPKDAYERGAAAAVEALGARLMMIAKLDAETQTVERPASVESCSAWQEAVFHRPPGTHPTTVKFLRQANSAMKLFWAAVLTSGPFPLVVQGYSTAIGGRPMVPFPFGPVGEAVAGEMSGWAQAVEKLSRGKAG